MAVAGNIRLLREAISGIDNFPKPKLAALWPEETFNISDFAAEWESHSQSGNPYNFASNFKDPCDMVLDRFEVNIPTKWLSTWPGKRNLIKSGWLAHEVELIPEADSTQSLDTSLDVPPEY
jgi:hypothetical protein